MTEPGVEEKIWSALSTSDKTSFSTMEIALAAGIAKSDAGKILNRWHREGKIDKGYLGIPRGGTPGTFTPVRWSLPGVECDDQPRADEPPISASVEHRRARSRRGELRDKILGVLQGSPDEEFSPSVLARELGHSSGAVSYALERLESTGHVDRTQDKPKRYRAN